MLHTYAVYDAKTGSLLGTVYALDRLDAEYIAQGTYFDTRTRDFRIYEIA